MCRLSSRSAALVPADNRQPFTGAFPSAASDVSQPFPTVLIAAMQAVVSCCIVFVGFPPGLDARRTCQSLPSRQTLLAALLVTLVCCKVLAGLVAKRPNAAQQSPQLPQAMVLTCIVLVSMSFARASVTPATHSPYCIYPCKSKSKAHQYNPFRIDLTVAIKPRRLDHVVAWKTCVPCDVREPRQHVHDRALQQHPEDISNP